MSDVLDRNLRELLRRHRAVVADPQFRERLGARFVAEALDAARSASGPGAERPAAALLPRLAPPRPVLRRAALLAAAGLLALFGAWWLAEGGGAPRSALDELLARAGVAAREQRDGDWHAIDGARLALAGDYLEAAHTGRAELAVDLPRLGEAALLAGTPARASFERESDAVRVRVQYGRVQLRRDGATTELSAGRSALVSLPTTIVLPDAGTDSAAPRPLAPTADAPPAELTQPPGELHGRVVRAADGTPVADALLVLAVTDVTAQGPHVVSQPLHAADGRFRWTPPPGHYHFFVLADGFATRVTRNVVIDAKLVLPDVRVELEPGVSVGGTVVDATTGAPLAGALVVSDSDWPSIGIPLNVEYLHGDGPKDDRFVRAHVLTGADGRFELPHLSSGGQVLRASAPGHAPGWLVLPAGAEPEATLRLSQGGGVEGHVVREDGQPWPQAVVVASFNSPEPMARTMAYGVTLTDADGHYRIEDLPALPGVVLLFDQDKPTAGMPPMLAVAIEAGRMATVDFGQPRTGAALSGTVTDADGGPGASLMLGLSPVGGNAMTEWSGQMADAHGGYRFTGLHAGSFDFFVAFSTNGSVTLIDRVQLAADEAQRLDVRLPGGGLAGRAVAADGSELVGATAVAWRQTSADPDFTGRAISDEHGRWTIRALPPGTYRVIVYDAHGTWADVQFEGLQVADAAVTGVDSTHPPGGQVHVRVARSGAPVAGAGITLRDLQGQVWELGRPYSVTGTDGTLRLVGVPAGRWEVEAEAGGVRATVRVDVEAGASAESALVLPAGP